MERVRYLIHPHNDPEQAEHIDTCAEMIERVDVLSGREGIMLAPSIRRQLRERGRTVIALNRDSVGRMLYGRFIDVCRITEGS